MGTTLRPTISANNKYWIERHRYYELKHFCLQYPIWKKAYAAIDGLNKRTRDLAAISKTNDIGDTTAKCAVAKIFYKDKIEMVEQVAMETDLELSNYILRAVTEGLSYNHLKTRLEIPCCRDVYYDLYRRFFWLLNKMRD